MGYWSWLSSAHVLKANPVCLRLLVQLIRCARALARASAGNNMAARMAMIAMTTNNSMRVKAPILLRRFFIRFLRFLFLVVVNRPRTLLEPFTVSTGFGKYLSNPDAKNAFC